ncbi:MAG: DUF4282 domain-containing protein [Thermoleophilia bacterium]
MSDGKLKGYLRFDRMLMPILIQVLFWLGVVGVVIGGIVTMTQKNGVGIGLAIIILGPIGVRLYAEMLIVIFKINDTLTEVKQDTARLP